MNIRLVVAYDGKPFRGWQSQKGGGTVQDALEKAVAGILGEQVTVHGSGRTDAGVHALAQTAHFELTPAQFSRLGPLQRPERWIAALNASLPPELRVLAARRATLDFHSRFSATGKVYRYHIWQSPVLPPHLYGRVWHLFGTLDRKVIHGLATAIVGTHDFRGFCANSRCLPEDTVRTLHRVTVSERGAAIRVTIEGNGFLYRMVRMLVGGMIRVAQGKEPADLFMNRLAEGKPWPTPAMAPAQGLYLAKVLYSKSGKTR